MVYHEQFFKLILHVTFVDNYNCFMD